MKITLRKRDSVTSIILFLFNLDSERTGSSNLRLSQILEYTSYFGKTESSVRTCLSRMVAQKFLLSTKKENETTFCLSKSGLASTQLWNRGMERFFTRMGQRQEAWDGQWHFISLREFNKSDYDNVAVVEELRESGMREFSRGLWISPYPPTVGLVESLKEFGIRVWHITGSLEVGSKPEEWLDSLFQISTTRSMYVEFLNLTDEISEAIKPKQGLELLPDLFHLGWAFYNVIVEDPVLPKELVLNWEGDIAAKAMRSLRSKIVEKLQ